MTKKKLRSTSADALGRVERRAALAEGANEVERRLRHLEEAFAPAAGNPKAEFLRALQLAEMHEELAKQAAKYGLSVSEAAKLGGLSVEAQTVAVAGETHAKYLEICRRLKQLAREWTSPHEMPTTAGNFELMAMNVARFVRGCDVLIEQHQVPCNWSELVNAAAETDPTIARVWASVDQWWELVPNRPEHKRVAADLSLESEASITSRHAAVNTIGAFLGSWLLGGFPRLEISHKYAAALCCTDCPPEIELRAPWKAWSLVVPPGLIGEHETPARLWMIGVKWVAVLMPNGRFYPLAHLDDEAAWREVSTPQELMMENLIRGACLSLSEPEQHRKAGGQARGKGNKRTGPPDLSQARFMLAPPVSVDLRAHVLEAAKPGGSGVPKVQFLVRGHWRQQAHGAGRALRKTIWIEPHWKGPEAGNVLLRPHKLKDDE